MKLAQFHDKDRMCMGIIEAEELIPLDFQGNMIDFIKQAPDCKASGKAIPLEQITFAPPISNPSKIVAIGLNYLDHIQEQKARVPESPIIFAKFPNTLIGHHDPITWDTNLTKKVDFEAELAVVIGKAIHKCTETDAMGAVFGYTCANDVSARDLQFKDRQWVRGKSLDTFCPLGPWIVTSDEIPDPHSVNIRCWLNGQIMQDSNTDLMLFKLPELISFISNNFTLVPGDIILTGTPYGVGTFREPPIYMEDGDEVIVEIENVGRLVNRCQTG